MQDMEKTENAIGEKSNPPEADKNRKLKIYFSIVVINWNGEDFIVRAVSSLLLSARNLKKPFELIVVDDASTDSSVEMVSKAFPDVRIIRSERNRGFIKSANRGVEEARADFVFLLNNDIVVKEPFVKNMIGCFEKEDEYLFAATAKTINWRDGSPNHLRMRANFKDGMFELTYDDPEKLLPAFFAQGGSTLFRKKIFLELGGFKDIFYPGYWEDYDLSYLALKCGYKIFYVPDAIAHHLGSASLKKILGEEGKNKLLGRNKFIFTWLNLTKPSFLFEHFLKLPFKVIKKAAMDRDVSLFKSFVCALPFLPSILKHRRHFLPTLKISDRELLSRK